MKRVRSSPEGSTPSLDESNDVFSGVPPDCWLALQHLRGLWNNSDTPLSTLAPVPAFPLSCLRGVLGSASSLSLDAHLRQQSVAGMVRVCTLGGERAVSSRADIDAFCEKFAAKKHIQFFSALAARFTGPSVSTTDIESCYAEWAAAHVSRVRIPAPPLEALLRELYLEGLLQVAGSGSRLIRGTSNFGAPSCGRLVSALASGRQSLRRTLTRAGPSGVLRARLLRRRESSRGGSAIAREAPEVPPAIILFDALGAGWAAVSGSPQGAVVRLIR